MAHLNSWRTPGRGRRRVPPPPETSSSGQPGEVRWRCRVAVGGNATWASPAESLRSRRRLTAGLACCSGARGPDSDVGSATSLEGRGTTLGIFSPDHHCFSVPTPPFPDRRVGAPRDGARLGRQRPCYAQWPKRPSCGTVASSSFLQTTALWAMSHWSCSRPVPSL